MNIFKRLYRLIQINYVLSRYGLDEIILATHLFRPLRFLSFFSLCRFNGQNQQPRGVRVRKALTELGPIFVKFGQVLSTRLDILPADIACELALLQDQVPPFCGKLAKQWIAHAQGKELNEIFLEFEETPLASASIAQVHAATLFNGQKVVVKVLRPHIRTLIKNDIAILKDIARLAERYWKPARAFKPREIIREFEQSLLDELDLMREAANASTLRRNFVHSEKLYIPEIQWEFTKNNILVMERIHGIPISNLQELKSAGFNLTHLAELMIEIFFTQVFRDCFFHADLHPGNIFVSKKNIYSPQFMAVDFGIMGSLGPKDQRYLAENFLALFNRDYRRVAELHQESGWIPPYIRLDEFEASIRTVCEPLFERPTQNISFGTVLLRLFQTAKRFHINIQPQLILLQKTLFNVEGLARQLDPNIDIWKTAKPVLEKWMKTQIGLRAFLRKISTNMPYWLERLPELPDLLMAALRTAAHPKQETTHEPHTKPKNVHESSPL